MVSIEPATRRSSLVQLGGYKQFQPAPVASLSVNVTIFF